MSEFFEIKPKYDTKGGKYCGCCAKIKHKSNDRQGCAICNHFNVDCCGSPGMYYPNECDMNTAVIEQQLEYDECENDLIDDYGDEI